MVDWRGFGKLIAPLQKNARRRGVMEGGPFEAQDKQAPPYISTLSMDRITEI
jgi:hypothetical protein